jgi:fucose 4-O-acetylase-like acetyltransferase
MDIRFLFPLGLSALMLTALVFKLQDPSKMGKQFTDEQRSQWERAQTSPAMLAGSTFILGWAAVMAVNWFDQTWAWSLWLLPAAMSLVDIGIMVRRRRESAQTRLSRALLLACLAGGLILLAGLLRRWSEDETPGQLGTLGWVVVGIQFAAIILAIVAGFAWFREAMRNQESGDKPSPT